MDHLMSSYPFGEQLAMALTPDRTRAFVAEGAVLTFLNVPGAPPFVSSPSVIQQLKVPEIQPLALEYFRLPGTPDQDWLFIAGGAFGLWALKLCPGIFQTPPTSCSSLVPQLLDVIDGTHFDHKRCCALAIDPLSTAAGRPVLYALFSASSSSAESPYLGPTEVRAYVIDGTNFGLLSTLQIPAASIPTTSSQKGTCLAIDPLHDSVYVGMGKGGIWKVTLTPSLSLTTTLSPMWPPSGGTVNVVQDMSIVQTATGQEFLYAALSYGNFLVYELTGSQSFRVISTGCGYPANIATAINGTKVLVAVAIDDVLGRVSEITAPFSINGVWSNKCLHPGVDDPDKPSSSQVPVCSQTPPPIPPTAPHQIQIFEDDLVLLPAQLTPRVILEEPDSSKNAWDRLVLAAPFQQQNLLYATSGYYGTQVIEIDAPQTGAWQANILTTYVGRALGAMDGSVAKRNPGVLRFGLEGSGAAVWEGYVAYADTVTPYDITIVPQSQYECPNGFQTGSCCGGNPGAFGGGAMGEASWIEPGTNREWFLPGRPAKLRRALTGCSTCASLGCDSCAPIPDCSIAWDPCDQNGYFHNVSWHSGDLPGYSQDRFTWQVITTTIQATGMPPNGQALAPRWEQLILPAKPQSPLYKAEQRNVATVYCMSITDPRFINGYPAAVYGIRGASDYGLQIFKPEELTAQAQASQGVGTQCNPAPNWTGGYGEQLNDSVLVNKLQVYTHIELERDGQGQGSDRCSDNNECGLNGRAFFNNRGDIFTTSNGSGGPPTSWRSLLASPRVDHRAS